MKMQSNTVLAHNEQGLISPTFARSEYGPISISTSINHNRQPSSPSTFSKERIYQKDSHRQVVDSAFPSSHQDTVHQLCLLSLPMEAESKMPLSSSSSKPGRIITPNPSFGERSMETLPDYLPNVAQHQRWDAKRSSVGLPSAYPGHGRHSSLAEAVMEELQDFDYFESSSPCCSNSNMEVDVESSSTTTSAVHPSSPRRSELISASAVSDPDLENGLSPVARRAVATEQPRRGRHRRTRNQAMSQDFFEQVMKDI